MLNSRMHRRSPSLRKLFYLNIILRNFLKCIPKFSFMGRIQLIMLKLTKVWWSQPGMFSIAWQANWSDWSSAFMLEILSKASNAVSLVKRSGKRMIYYLSHVRSYKPQHRAIKQQFKNNPNTAYSKSEGVARLLKKQQTVRQATILNISKLEY